MKESLEEAFPIIKNGPGISVDDLKKSCLSKHVCLEPQTKKLIHLCMDGFNPCRFRGVSILIQDQTVAIDGSDVSFLEGSELTGCDLTWENFRLRSPLNYF